MRLLSNHKILQTLAILAAGVLSVSCMQKEDFGSDIGYLCPPSLDLDVTVDNLADTKAGEQINLSEAGLSVPTATDVTYIVTDKDGNQVHNGALWTEPLALPVGSYTITASAGTNTFGTPYFAATHTGTIEALDKETPTIAMVLGNSLLKVVVAEDMTDHFKSPYTLSLSSGGNASTVDYNTWCYVPSGSAIDITLNGISSTGEEKTFHYAHPALAANTASNVICGKDENFPSITLPEQQNGAWNTRLYIDPALVNGTISDDNKAKLVYEVSTSSTDWTSLQGTVKHIQDNYYYVDGLTNSSTYYVRARIGNIVSETRTFTVNENLPGTSLTLKHENDGSGNLERTDATLSLGLKGMIKTLHDDGILKVGSNLTIGSTLYREASADGLMTVSNGWTYLPQGSSYILSISHRLESDTEPLVSKSTHTVKAPEFTVTLTSYSSYDKYLENNPDAANGMDAHTIEGIGATWTISNTLLSDERYSKSLAYTYDGSTSTLAITSNTYSASNKTGQSIGSHSISATVTFDGEPITASKTHHITGMPFRETPPTAANWTGSVIGCSKASVNFNSDHVELRTQTLNGWLLWDYTATTTMITIKNTFQLPASVNIRIINTVESGGGSTSTLNPKYSLIFGSNALINESNDKDISYDTNTFFEKGSYSVQMKSYYGSATEGYSRLVKKIEVLYGPLP